MVASVPSFNGDQGSSYFKLSRMISRQFDGQGCHWYKFWVARKELQVGTDLLAGCLLINWNIGTDGLLGMLAGREFLCY